MADMNDMNRQVNEMKYNKQGRYTLLLLCILSVVNIVFIYALDMYFYFSVHIVNVLAALGAYTPDAAALFIVLAILVTGIYLLCWLLSKKNYIWMLVAAVLYGIDTVLLLIDMFSVDATFIMQYSIDLVFHIAIIVYLIRAVVQGKKAKKNGMKTVEEILGINPQQESEAVQEQSPYAEVRRTIKINRLKAFSACALALTVYVDGQEFAKVKNGDMTAFTIDGVKHQIMCSFPSTGASSQVLDIEEGEQDKYYTVKVKMGAFSAGFDFQETTEQVFETSLTKKKK